MTISSSAQAVLLMTIHFTKNEGESIRPLAPKEWGKFSEWLQAQKLTPDLLLGGNLPALLNGWSDKSVTLERLEKLLGRGSALALSTEKWLRSGLWVMTRSDKDYPKRLKQLLRTDSPAVLFGCGHRALLNQEGLAIVGSRNTNNADLIYSRELGAETARSGYSVISGGARGVDDAAMLGALKVEGTAIGVLADNLLRSSSSAKFRSYLSNKSLVLVSPFNPEVGFNVGNAMQRNKYIYCLSGAAVAVHSGIKGGTWNGAKENIKKKWVPMWVKKTNDKDAGNSPLVDLGAAWISDKISEVDVFDLLRSPKDVDRDIICSRPENMEIPPIKEKVEKPPVSDMEFYDFFLTKTQYLCSDKPHTKDELLEAMKINNAQLNIWLKQAVVDQKLRKLSKPVRYQWIGGQQAMLPFE
jgi:predicted Rossmann fold nucleotide-binding protein DprA/Smf involved in DNA uptake